MVGGYGKRSLKNKNSFSATSFASQQNSRSSFLSFFYNRNTDHAIGQEGPILLKLSSSSCQYSPSMSSRCSAITCSVLKTVKYSHATKSRDWEEIAYLETRARSTILVFEKLGKAGLELLCSFGNMGNSYDLSPEQLCEKITLCDALIVRNGTEVIRQALEVVEGHSKVVGGVGVGIDNVDLQVATQFDCPEVNAPTANTVVATEYGFALIAAMARKVVQIDAFMKARSKCNVLGAEKWVDYFDLQVDNMGCPIQMKLLIV